MSRDLVVIEVRSQNPPPLLLSYILLTLALGCQMTHRKVTVFPFLVKRWSLDRIVRQVKTCPTIILKLFIKRLFNNKFCFSEIWIVA